MSKIEPPFDKILALLQEGMLGWERGDELKQQGATGARSAQASIQNLDPDWVGSHLPQGSDWILDMLSHHLDLEACVLYQDHEQEGDGKRFQVVVGQQNPESWALDLSYFVSDEDYYLGSCFVQLIEGERGVREHLAQIEQVGLEGAAGEIARIIQEATSLTLSKLMALRNALAENPAGQAALTAWDTIAVHEQMEQDTAQTPNKLRKNRL